ncbi:MAG: hypothetical protein IPJ19_17060 [Planctomycetes bacterium]|nr:hypothetical protein [Planctomycetota bacterium]
MSSAPRAWVLNLDAEHELEAQGRYQPTQHLLRIVERERMRLVGTLVGPQDVVLGLGDPERARGLPGVAWSPTPRALAQLRAAGAEPLAAPALEVLRAVNARPFAASVREPLQRASFEKHVVLDLESVLARLALPAPEGWLVRRTFGAAGRGRRRIAAGEPSESERAWIVASLRLGPLVVEPWVQVTREYTRSAFVATDGSVTISAPCFQETTREGAWTGTTLAGAGELAREDDAELEAAVAAAGAALARAGYFGPFGIDAYRHREPGGRREILNPLSEINARFTMDWALGMERGPVLAGPRARVGRG